MGFFDGIFGRKAAEEELPPPPPPPPTLICLSCLERTELKRLPLFCDACGAEVPPLYAAEPGKFPVLGLQVFGRSRHGKTVYLYALTMMLKRLQRLWQSGCDGYTFLPISEESQMRAREIDLHLGQSASQIAATALNADDVYLALLQDMVRWGDRALAIRDSAGEAFEKMTIDTNVARFLLGSAGILMILSFESFKPGAMDAIEVPLNNYVHTLTRSGKAPQGRRVVVVFTKADMQLASLPASLRDYLQQDPLAYLADPGAGHPLGERPPFDAAGVFHYLEGMKLADQEIRRWLEKSGHGNSLDVLAKRHGIELRYCLVSATGSPVTAGDFPESWSPKRVLDPIFWFLELA